RLPALSFGDQESNFAFYLTPGFELIEDFGGTSPQEFFVELCHLPGYDYVPVRVHDFDYIRERFQQPVWGFVEDLGSFGVADALEEFAALAGLRGEESAEAEGIGRQAAGD